MKFKLVHTSRYIFDDKVFLEPHYLRFRLQPSPFLTILKFSLSVEPEATGNRTLIDEENNLVNFCWFNGLTKEFVTTATSFIKIEDYNPFDFIIQPNHFNKIPFKYDILQNQLLKSSLTRLNISNDLIEYSGKILKAVSGNTIEFLTRVTKEIHKDFDVVYRELGAPLEPNETFANRSGSCRDLSWMLIGILRHYNIATRFVSGYYYFEMDKPAYELHAWVSVFLPGVGWMGLDPSHGVLTGNTHFVLASSGHYNQTMPISGSIRGSAFSQLITSLTIEKI